MARADTTATVTSLLEDFAAMAGRGSFGLPTCTHCSQVHWPPRSHCPYCLQPVLLQASLGLGEVFASTLIRRGAPQGAPTQELPLAFVRLDEGVCVLALVTSAGTPPPIGTSVRFDPTATADVDGVPCFRVLATDPSTDA